MKGVRRLADQGLAVVLVEQFANLALEIGDRRAAITTGIEGLQADDVLIVAGKGHEQGQTVGDRVLPFDDATVVREIVGGTGS